jgi:hypothetical protein
MDNSRVFNNQLVLVDFDIELVGFPLPHGGDTFAVCGWETQEREKVSETKILTYLMMVPANFNVSLGWWSCGYKGC